MRRFIRYLYEYEQEKKMRNVGFVKVEQDVDQCVIHVHGKGFRMEENTQGLRVYLFWNTEDKCYEVGKTMYWNPAGSDRGSRPGGELAAMLYTGGCR